MGKGRVGNGRVGESGDRGVLYFRVGRGEWGKDFLYFPFLWEVCWAFPFLYFPFLYFPFL